MSDNDTRSKITNLQAKRRALSEEIESIQRNCTHEWGYVYDPENGLREVWDGTTYDVHGSDIYPKVRFETKKIDRWAITCKKCGKIDGYTNKSPAS